MLRSVFIASVVLLCIVSSCVGATSAKEEKKEMKEAKKDVLSYDSLLKEVNEMEKRVISKEKQLEKDVASKVEDNLKKRSAEILKKKNECKAIKKEADRVSCEKQVAKEMRRNKREHKLVRQLKKCDSTHKKDTKARVKCVEKLAIAFLRLQPKAVEKKLAKKAKVDTKNAIRKVKRGADSAPKEIKAAIKDLRKRNAAIKARAKACNILKVHGEKHACRAEVRQQIQAARHAVTLLKRLGRCGKVFSDDESKRKRCVKIIGAKLTAALKKETHKISKRYPKTLEELKTIQRRGKRALATLIKSLIAQHKKCKDRRCKRTLAKKIKGALWLLKNIGRNFRARRVCLMRRRQVRKAEFRTRAKEHARLARLHGQALGCTSNECVEHVARKQRKLSARISRSRDVRHRKWKALRCPGVQPVDLSKARTMAERKRARRHGRYTRRARLHLKLNRAYRVLSKCQSKRCRQLLEKRVARLERRLRLLSRAEGLDRAKRRHGRRARLHERLTLLYRRAAACETTRCRMVTRAELRSLKAALAKIRRDFLGRRQLNSERAEAHNQDREDKALKLREKAKKAQKKTQKKTQKKKSDRRKASKDSKKVKHHVDVRAKEDAAAWMVEDADEEKDNKRIKRERNAAKKAAKKTGRSSSASLDHSETAELTPEERVTLELASQRAKSRRRRRQYALEASRAQIEHKLRPAGKETDVVQELLQRPGVRAETAEDEVEETTTKVVQTKEPKVAAGQVTLDDLASYGV